MSSFTVALCLTFLFYVCVDASENNCSVCACETCHEYINKLKPQYCSVEKEFVIGLTEVNWFRAVDNCEKAGYYKLASIKNEKETIKLLAAIKEAGLDYDSYWLSGTDMHNEEDFVWWTSPEAEFKNYTNWNPEGEPRSKNIEEDCVQVSADGTWKVRRCYDEHFYICEYYLSI